MMGEGIAKLVGKELVKVPTLCFNNGSWGEHTKSDTNTVTSKEISFITYNIWFETHNWDNRMEALLNIFKSYSPDVICLQEVTSNSNEILSGSQFIRENYYMSGNFQSGYDVLMLTKFPSSFYVSKFDSKMGRKLLLTELKALQGLQGLQSENSNILIGTSHFESLNSARLRKSQLEQSFNILSNSPISFLMGDFNFDPSWKAEQQNIDSSYEDSWMVYKNFNKIEEEGYTMKADYGFPAWRPDRLLFRSVGKEKEKNVKLEHFEIIGRDPIEVNKETSYSNVDTPSDHFGLYAKFSL